MDEGLACCRWGDGWPDIPLEEVDFVFLDVETTGLRPYLGDRICEIALLRRRGHKELGSFHSLVNPGCPISPGASAVSGIRDEDVADAPPFQAIAGQVIPFLEGAVLVAHNAPFDMGFISAQWQRLGLPLPDNLAIDTLALARNYLPFRYHSLPYLVGALEIRAEGLHRAMADVDATVKLFNHLMDVLCPQGVRTLGDLLEAQGGPIPWVHMEEVLLPPTLAEALVDQGEVWICYISAQGQRTERVIRPISVISGPGNLLYLEAHCCMRGELRYFRVDRIVSLRPAEPGEVLWD